MKFNTPKTSVKVIRSETTNTFEARHEEQQISSVELIDEKNIPHINGIVKRAFDIVISLLALILLSPLLFIIVIIISITSRGQILCPQWRYGKGKTYFNMLKFRTMSVCEDGYSMKMVVKNDNRITSFGKLLRKYSMDELPQFFNVLKGDMSIVGPRPHAISMVNEYSKQVSGIHFRHLIKPGITGLAQLYGPRCENNTADNINIIIYFDKLYIHTWSHLLDLKIFICTFYHVLFNTKNVV